MVEDSVKTGEDDRWLEQYGRTHTESDTQSKLALVGPETLIAQ